MIEPGVTAQEVCARTGLSYRVLDYWLRTGVAEASIAPGGGSGMPRLFSPRDVRLLVVLATLRLMGINRTAMLAAIGAQLRAHALVGLLHVRPPQGEVSWEPGEGWAHWLTIDLDQLLGNDKAEEPEPLGRSSSLVA